MTGVVRAALLLSFLGAADAARVRQQMILEGGVQSSHRLALDKLAGQRWGKYVLQKHIESYHLSSDEGNVFDAASEVDGASVYSSLLEDRAGTFANESVIPPRRFNHKKYQLGELLGKGSFGAAYSATADGDPAQRVVLKFIYTFREEHMHLVTGTSEDIAEFGTQLRDLELECGELENVQRAASHNALGASRLINCYARCFRTPRTPSDCSTGRRDPQFIVMDDGGQNGNEWLIQHSHDKHAIAEVLQQVAQGLDYLTENLDPPLIHHDLKWDNIAVRFQRGVAMDILLTTIVVKIIDFGGAIEKTLGTGKEGSVCTRGFGPPEWEYGYAYFGPSSAFDIYSLGAMALHGLCEVSFRDLKKVAQYGEKLFEKVVIRKMEPAGDILDLIGLKGLHSGPGGNRACRTSMEMLLHPLPEMRLLPSEVEFTTTGAMDKRMWAIRAGADIWADDNGLPEPPSGSLALLQRDLDSVPTVVSNNWADLLYPREGPSSTCMAQEGGHRAMADGRGGHHTVRRLAGALKLLTNATDQDPEAMYKLADKIPDILRSMMVDETGKRAEMGDVGLRPFSEHEDRLLVGCILNVAAGLGGAHRGYRTSTAQSMMALLQWGELWKDPEPETVLPGSRFARELIWGGENANVFVKDFEGMLDGVARKAYALYKAAGNAAVPSWKSALHSWFSAKVMKRNRYLYRRVHYLVQARLQAAALRISCSVNMARQAGPILKLLHDTGHEGKTKIKHATVTRFKEYFRHAHKRLVEVKDSANVLRLAFLKVSDNGPLHSNLPPLTEFDDTDGWSGWYDDVQESFASRSTSESGFHYPEAERKGAPVCPDSDIVAWDASALAALSAEDPTMLQGMYQAFKEAVVGNLQKGMDGIYEVLEYEEKQSSNDHSNVPGMKQRSFKLGAAMQADVFAAGAALANFARQNDEMDFNHRGDNVVNIDLNVLEKVYHGSDDEEFDALGVGGSGIQPGVIYHVKQLIWAANSVKVHPSQDESL